jgi:hypothetical protein
MRRIIICQTCQKTAPHHGYGKCLSCYLIEYRQRPEYRSRRAEYDARYAEKQAAREFELLQQQRPTPPPKMRFGVKLDFE